MTATLGGWRPRTFPAFRDRRGRPARATRGRHTAQSSLSLFLASSHRGSPLFLDLIGCLRPLLFPQGYLLTLLLAVDVHLILVHGPTFREFVADPECGLDAVRLQRLRREVRVCLLRSLALTVSGQYIQRRGGSGLLDKGDATIDNARLDNIVRETFILKLLAKNHQL